MAENLTIIELPTTALLQLRDVWEKLDEDSLRSQSLELLRDLFGGQDGRLLRIDAVLPVDNAAWVDLNTVARGFNHTKNGYHVVGWKGSQWATGWSSRVQLAKAKEEVEQLVRFGGYTRIDIYRQARQTPGARLGMLQVSEVVESKVLV